MGALLGPNDLKKFSIDGYMAGVPKTHDFVYFSINLVPVMLFLKKNYEIWENKLKK